MSSKRRKGTVFRVVLGIFSLILTITGGALLIGSITAPDKTEEVVYGAKTKVESQISKVSEAITGEYPTINFVGSGGIYELNNATYNQFVRIESYETEEGMQQTWAAHNSYGGDALLQWEVGQKINVVGGGHDGVWVVVDYRDVDKFGYVSQAVGMQGDLALQTCHYGVDVIRFVGIVPESIYEAGWPPPVSQQSGIEETSENSPEVAFVVED